MLGGVAHTYCHQNSLSSGAWKVGFHNKTATVTAAGDLNLVSGQAENSSIYNVAY
jgi:fructose-specific phosphotransferase system component IIB